MHASRWRMEELMQSCKLLATEFTRLAEIQSDESGAEGGDNEEEEEEEDSLMVALSGRWARVTKFVRASVVERRQGTQHVSKRREKKLSVCRDPRTFDGAPPFGIFFFFPRARAHPGGYLVRTRGVTKMIIF